jgi:hypothetical protein
VSLERRVWPFRVFGEDEPVGAELAPMSKLRSLRAAAGRVLGSRQAGRVSRRQGVDHEGRHGGVRWCGVDAVVGVEARDDDGGRPLNSIYDR